MDWHRLFGLLLTDFFTGSPFVVELEKDLSLKEQRLDVVIVRLRPKAFAGELPDGLGDLAAHNLITFKSHWEPLDDWGVQELTGHYVNYRKQASPENGPLLSAEEFRLYAVCSRYPRKLATDVGLHKRGPGVYECQRGSNRITVIVAGRLPRAERNAPLHLFAATPEAVGYGAEHYRRRSQDTSSLLNQLLTGYQREGIAMPYTMADFRRDYVIEHFPELTDEERARLLQKLPLEDRLKDLSPAQRARLLQKLPPAERLKDLPAEQRLEGLTREEIEAYLQNLPGGRAAPKRKPRRKP